MVQVANKKAPALAATGAKEKMAVAKGQYAIKRHTGQVYGYSFPNMQNAESVKNVNLAVNLLSAIASYGLFFRLTHVRGLEQTELPQTIQGVTDAFPVPHTAEKSGFFCFCHQRATGASCVRGYILAEHVLMFVRLRQLCIGWGACSVFFCAQSLKLCRWLMFSISFPAAYCGLSVCSSPASLLLAYLPVCRGEVL